MYSTARQHRCYGAASLIICVPSELLDVRTISEVGGRRKLITSIAELRAGR